MKYIQVISFPHETEDKISDWKNYFRVTDHDKKITEDEFLEISEQFKTHWEYEDIDTITEECKSKFFVYKFYERSIYDIEFCETKEDAEKLFWKYVHNFTTTSLATNNDFLGIFNSNFDTYYETKASQFMNDLIVSNPDKSYAFGFVTLK